MPGVDVLQEVLTSASQERPEPHPLVRDIDANIDRFNRLLGYGESYDIILRRFRVAGVQVAAYVINGFFTTLTNLEMLKQVATAESWVLPDGGGRDTDAPTEPGSRLRMLKALLSDKLAYSQVVVVQDFDAAVVQLLSGPMIVLVDGETSVIVIDTRYYPDREPSSPHVERLMRGPRDAFIENIIDNTALIRRRVRDPGLRFEMIKGHVGRRSKTDVAIGYIKGLTDPKLVATVRERLEAIDIDGIPMAEQPIAELVTRQQWNPFPTYRMTERPDVAAQNLLNGHVLIIVDTTPVAITLPVSVFQLLQHPEDYHVAPTFGTWLRLMEWFALVTATLVPAVWLLLATHPGILARLPALSFIGSQKPSPIPLPLQFILAEFSIDVLRRAVLNSAAALATSFGILGAVVLGQVATKVNLFSPEALLYLVGAAIASFAISNLELGMASRLVRVSLIVLEWVMSLPGLVLGVIFWLVMLLRTDSLGRSYLWPLIPFDWPSLRSVLIREPVTGRVPRPEMLDPLDRWRSAH